MKNHKYSQFMFTIYIVYTILIISNVLHAET